MPVPIFLINLDRSTDRLERIDGEFKSLGINYERISAVNGKELNSFKPAFNPKRFLLESEHELQPGEVGCSLSHIGIWERIRDEALPGAIVIEDDVILTPKLVEFIQIAEHTEMDYLKIDIGANELGDNGEVFDESLTIINRTKIEGFEVLETDLAPLTTGAYFISNNGAKTFLKFAKKMYYPVDLLPRYVFPYTKQGYLQPPCVVLNNVESTIDGRQFIKPKGISRFFSKIFSSKRLRDMAVAFRKLKGQ